MEAGKGVVLVVVPDGSEGGVGMEMAWMAFSQRV